MTTELDLPTIGVIIGIASAIFGGGIAIGKLIEKVNSLEKRLDKIESDKNNEKKN